VRAGSVAEVTPVVTLGPSQSLAILFSFNYMIDSGQVWRYPPVIIVRDATNRLGGRWPECLAQRSGQNPHEESGISEGLHLSNGSARMDWVGCVLTEEGEDSDAGLAARNPWGLFI